MTLDILLKTLSKRGWNQYKWIGRGKIVLRNSYNPKIITIDTLGGKSGKPFTVWYRNSISFLKSNDARDLLEIYGPSAFEKGFTTLTFTNL